MGEGDYKRKEGQKEDALERIFHHPGSWVNLILVGINVLVFAAVSLTGSSFDNPHMIRWGASFTPLVEDGEYWRLFTSMFLHFGVQHLFNNMVLLLFLGDVLERQVGHLKYLLIYVGGGVGGNILSFLAETGQGELVVSAGASGAAFAVIGALLYVLIRKSGRLETITVQRLAFMALLSLYYGFSSAQVDNAAHIGGLFSGFLLTVILFHPGRRGR